jgi:hypothetical protein
MKFSYYTGNGDDPELVPTTMIKKIRKSTKRDTRI